METYVMPESQQRRIVEAAGVDPNGCPVLGMVALPTAAQANANGAIRAATLAAAGIGIPVLLHPGIDEGGMTLIWVTMIARLAQIHRLDVSKEAVAKCVATAISGVAAYSLG